MSAAATEIVTSGDAASIQQFTYLARNTEGKVVRGNAKAVNKTEVVKELLRKNLTPLDINGGAAASPSSSGGGLRRTAKRKDLVITTRLLASMLDSSLSTIESLDIVRKDTEDPLLASAFNEVRIAVQNGSSLSRAMEAQGDVFPSLMINLIATGEAAGEVKQAMVRVADQMEKEDKLRSKIRKALMYPAFVFLIGGIVFAFMMLVLVPMFTDTFLEIGGPGTELPPLTQAVVTVSNVAKYVIPAIVVLSVPAFFWYRNVKDRENVREFVDPLKFKIPIFGNLFHKIAIARWAQNLSGLLGAGVDRLQALEISARTCGNIAMERAVLAAREAQRQGKPLVDPLREEPLFPNRILQMVEAGERSGSTPFMLGKAAEVYDRDVDTITDTMTEMVGPLLMLCLGILVGVVVIAVYLPYMHLGEAIDAGQ